MSDVTAQKVRSINDAGIAVLRGERSEVRYTRNIRTLLDPKLRGAERKTPEFHEAVVSMCVIGRTFPNKARGHLKRLEQICNEAGNPKRFQVFRAMVNAYLSPEILSGHGYQAENLADMDLREISKGLAHVTAPLRDLGYDYFVNSGSLLGLTREGGLLEHDDDIDLAVVLNATDEDAAIQEWKDLRETLSKQGAIDEEVKPSPVCKLKRVSGIMIDLFPCWMQDGQAFIYPYSYGALKQQDFLPLQSCPETGLPVPANAASVLAQNYGEGWREPDPYFRFPWRAAKKNFKKLVAEYDNDKD